MPSKLRRVTRDILRFGFQQLYTNFAWTYDAVAALVSLGEWHAWARTVIRYIDTPAERPKPRLLEIAHGPGHLHLKLRQLGYPTAGIDLSPQMSRQASRRLRRAGLSNSVAQASVYRLPFPDAAFAALISTFPADFIFAPEMLREAWRVLLKGGQMLVVMTAIPHADNALARIVSLWQSSHPWSEAEALSVRECFEQSCFTFREHRVPADRFDVVVWVMGKQENEGETQEDRQERKGQ